MSIEYKIKVPRCCHQTVPGQEPPSASPSLPRRDSRRLRGPQRWPQQEKYFTERRSGGEGGGWSGATAVFTTAAHSGLSGRVVMICGTLCRDYGGNKASVYSVDCLLYTGPTFHKTIHGVNSS